MRSRSFAPARLLVASLVLVAPLLARAQALEVASRQPAVDGGARGNGLSVRPSASATGRLVAFDSRATNLLPGGGADVNGTAFDVFVRDRAADGLELVSRRALADGGAQATGGDSFSPSMSADGRIVAFVSAATNLIPGGGADANGIRWDIFAFDRVTRGLELISRQALASGGAQAGSDSDDPATSGDGNFVAFESLATNLGGTEPDGLATDLFVRDRAAGDLDWICRQGLAEGGAAASGNCLNPSISGDGRYVAFNSRATNLVPGAPGGAPDANGAADDVFVFDRVTRQLELVSRRSAADGGAQAIGGVSTDPSISADGRFVAFVSRATNLIPGGGADANPSEDIFVYDRMTGSLELASREAAADGGAQANGASVEAAISGDGRFVAFKSFATNLIPGNGFDANLAQPDVFRFDRSDGSLDLVSRQAAADGGAQANALSQHPALSGDGAVATFASDGSNLTPAFPDLNLVSDVYVTDFQPPPPPNEPPIAVAGPDQNVSEGALVVLDGSGSSDPEGEPLGYAWLQTSGTPVALDLTDPGRPRFVAPAVAPAGEVLVFDLEVTDPAGATDTDSVQIAVANVNAPPLANAGADQTVAESATVTLDGSASADGDGDVLGYAWTQTAGPLVSLTGANTAQPSFVAPQVGAAGATLRFELSVSDGQAASSDSVDVFVTNLNLAPTANAGPDQVADEGTSVVLDGTASADPDGDPIFYLWSQVAGPAVALDLTNPARPTFVAPGVPLGGTTLVFALVVSDGAAASPADSVDVVVRNVNHPPVANAGANQIVDEGTAVALDGAASFDSDGEALSYAWSQLSGTTVALAGADTATPSFQAPAIAAPSETLVFELTVSDGASTSADAVSVVVANQVVGDVAVVREARFGLVSLARGQTARLSAVCYPPDPCHFRLGFLDAAGNPFRDAAGQPIAAEYDVAPGASASLDLLSGDAFRGVSGVRIPVRPTLTEQAVDELEPLKTDGEFAYEVSDQVTGRILFVLYPLRTTTTVYWPNRIHRTLQQAIDAVPDGETLRIAAGVFHVDSPVFVRGKRISILGSGCDELRSRPSATVTHLVGPPVDRVVEANAAIGLLNFVDAGGLVRGLKLSGFDAGIRGFDEHAPTGGARPRGPGISIEDTCVADTGRGIAWSATGALAVRNAVIRDVAWNGVSVFRSPSTQIATSFSANNLYMYRALNACIVIKGWTLGPTAVALQNADLTNCGNGGIVLEWVDAHLKKLVLAGIDGPAIAAKTSFMDVRETSVTQARGHGIYLDHPFGTSVETTTISNTLPFLTGKPFGDGLTVLGAGLQGQRVYLDYVWIENSWRAAIGNFGNVVSLGNVFMRCAAFELDRESFEGSSGSWEDRGGNGCGCPLANQACVETSSALEPPAPLSAAE